MIAEQPLASKLVRIFVFTCILVSLTIAWTSQLPGDNQQFRIAEQTFNLSNARQHLRQITQAPHYTGSPEHKRVRDYLVAELQALGLEVQVQQDLALSSGHFVAANVSNIIARYSSGSAVTKGTALALVSHYDSASYSSYGASDAGSGVVTILEAMRTLIASQVAVQNDIYVIFTDAEEQGLLGARAFVKSHPWSTNIGLVLNFEARGSGGPSYTLIETNHGNKALVDAFARAGIKHPAANSMMYSIYKMLPNDTDLTVFREDADINGFNFAFIDDHYDYHTAQDTPQRLDQSTLNHQVDYITALLPVFANMDLTTLNSDQDQVYFNFANWAVYHYPFSWVMPMAILVAFVFAMMLANGIKQQRLTPRHLLLACAPALGGVVLGALIGFGIWQALLLIYPHFGHSPHGFPYAGHYIIALTILTTVLLCPMVYHWMMKRYEGLSLAEWYTPITLIWIVLNIVLGAYLTGAGFFILIAISALATLSNLMRPHTSANRQLILITLISLPGLIVIGPQIPVLVIGLGMDSLVLASTLTALLVLSLTPIFVMLKGGRILPLTLLIAVLACLFGIAHNSAYSPTRKKDSSVNYLYDTQSEQAFLFSFDKQLDGFSQPIFHNAQRDNAAIRRFFPITAWRSPTYVVPTPPLSLPATEIKASKEQLPDGSVQVTLQIQSRRHLDRLQLMSDLSIKIHQLSINGKTFDYTKRVVRPGFFAYYVAPSQQPISIEFSYSAEQAPQFRLLGITHDLQQQWPEFGQRPSDIMPTPFRLTDTTIISQPIIFANM